jgi:hypothetical protein
MQRSHGLENGQYLGFLRGLGDEIRDVEICFLSIFTIETS